MSVQKKNSAGPPSDMANRAFHLLIRMVFYIAGPAFLAAFVGKHIDLAAGTGKRYSLICLGVAFVCSWLLVFLDYQYIVKPKQITHTEEGNREELSDDISRDI